MEKVLATHLFVLCSRFSELEGISESTIGKLCAQDARFFSRIREGKTFTVKKFDGVVGWFAENWPEGEPWPLDLVRPCSNFEALS